MVRNESFATVKKNALCILGDDLAACERMSAVLDAAAAIAAPGLIRMLRENRFSAEEVRRESLHGLPELPETLFAETPAENLPLARAKMAADTGAYLAAFAARLTEKLASSRMHPSPSLFVTRAADAAGCSVALPHTAAFQRACEVLCTSATAPTVRHVRSFSDACEAVIGGDCTHLILPLENSRDGFLSTTLRMLTENDLFITRVCRLTDESGVTTRFALLCREADAHPDCGDAPQVAMRLPLGDASLSWMFTAMAALGVKLLRTVSQPLGYTDGYAQLCTFGGTPDALFAWLLLLEAAHTNYSLLGVYASVDAD